VKQINFDCSDDLRVCALSQSERRQRSGFTMCMFFGLFLLSLVCCAFRSVPAPIVLTVADNGKTVIASPGTSIIVRLADNAGSTGYKWSFLTTGKPVVRLQSTKYFAPTFAPGSHPRVGAPGVIEFTFVAQHSGDSPLKFVLRRPWEKGVPPAQRFGVVIHVTAPHVTAPHVIAPHVIAPHVTHHSSIDRLHRTLG
jgi:predicted secreted protein